MPGKKTNSHTPNASQPATKLVLEKHVNNNSLLGSVFETIKIVVKIIFQESGLLIKFALLIIFASDFIQFNTFYPDHFYRYSRLFRTSNHQVYFSYLSYLQQLNKENLAVCV